jgi:hypothetical protein
MKGTRFLLPFMHGVDMLAIEQAILLNASRESLRGCDKMRKSVWQIGLLGSNVRFTPLRGLLLQTFLMPVLPYSSSVALLLGTR